MDFVPRCRVAALAEENRQLQAQAAHAQVRLLTRRQALCLLVFE